jgi:hypothetical protein
VKRAGLLLALAALLGGCNIPTMRTQVDALDMLGPGEVVVVGKFHMSPPFVAAEKDMHMQGAIVVGAGRMEQNLWALVGPGPFKGEDEPEAGDYNGAIETPWDQLFYARFAKGRPVLQLVAVAMTLSQKAYYPLNLKLDLHEDDQVVYIGSIKLSRDDFNNPTGLQVVDDGEAAIPAIKKRLGKKARVRTALPKRLS